MTVAASGEQQVGLGALLANRRYVSTFMEKESARVMRAWSARGRGVEEPQSLAVLIVDADHFKVVNDTCGHTAGDAMLREINYRAGQVARDLAIKTRNFSALVPAGMMGSEAA